MTEEYFTLNNDVKIPKMGIGTFRMSPNQAQKAVEDALEDGYHLVDTAQAYNNERGVAQAIKNSKILREELFVSTKLWPSVYSDSNAVDDALKRLGVDYIDLLFLHQPSGDWKKAYRTLEKAYKEGKIRAIGISNFERSSATLQEVLDFAEIKPQVLQAEAHPYFPQTEAREILKPYGTRLMAWYPLGSGDRNLINEPIFTELAKKYNKTNAQIILRWHTQMGFIVIPGSTNPEHIHDNHDIYDFELTKEEMAEIAKINKNRRYY
ncbi:aldo/keto reductase [Lactobacillus sp. LL6]|uniref:aldo/keto reductase n=1 Tax=Lactobacillus sp. LL6 TaxID=2596827 RepID=UPI0011851191|nr:aldo/keto reductase [Lactobacillus sp. LL6]TSO26386.1 aldo/keto reductase [Lactobacillus sp. LL6]